MSITPAIVEAPHEVFDVALAGSTPLASAFLRSTSEQRIALCELWPAGADPTARTVFATHNFVSLGSDAIAADLYYQALIKTGLKVSRSLVDGTRLRGIAEPDTAVLSLLNERGALEDLSPESGSAIVAIGDPAMLFLTGSDWPRASRKRIFNGVLDDVTPASDSRAVTLALRSSIFNTDKPVQTRRFQGLGQALGFREAEPDVLTLAYFADMNQSVLVYEVFCKLRTLPSVTVSLGGRSGAFRFWIGTAFHLNAKVIDASANEVHCVTTEVVAVDDEYHLYSMRWDGATLDIFIDGVLVESEPISGGFGVLDLTVTSDLVVGDGSGYAAPDADITEIRLWRTARTDEEIFAAARRRLPDPEDGNLVLYLPINEGEGTSTFDDERGYEATIATDVPWVSTFTGDAELAGKLMPTSWGFVWHRDAVPVDVQARFYQAHSREVRSFDRVYEGGRPLIPDYVTSSHLASYYAPTRKIYGGDFDFRRFVPGQKVTISAGLNAGDFTVQAVDQVAGLWMRVFETLTGGSDDEATPIEISTFAGTAEYVDYLELGGFALNASAEKKVTCRIRGDVDPVDGYVDDAGGLIRRIGKVALGMEDAHFSSSFDDIASAWGTECGFATVGEEEVPVKEAWSRLASGIGANVSDLDGLLDIEVFTAPPELDLDTPSDSRLLLTQANILAIERLRTSLPVEKAVVNFRPNYCVMAIDDLAGEVQEPVDAAGRKHLQELTNPSTSVESVGTSPAATAGDRDPADVLESTMIRPGWAQVLAQRNFELYGVKREFFRVRTLTEPYLHDLKRCTVAIIHPNWATLVDGKACRMVSLEGGRFVTELGVWG